MGIILEKAKDREDWEDFNQSHKYGYFLQSWDWGELQSKFYDKSVNRGYIIRNGEKIGLMQVIREKSRFGDICYIPRGPVIDWQDSDLAFEVLNKLKVFFQNKNCLLLRLDPAISKDSKLSKIFKKAGYHDGILTIQAENPWIIDIDDRSNEELFEWMRNHDMRSKVPNYIRGSRRKGVEIKLARNMAQVEIFLKMIKQMNEALNIQIGNPKYLRQMYEEMGDKFKIFLGYYKDKPVVCAGIMMYGDEASYLYGASTPEIGNSNAAYLLQWEAIKHARKLGISRYNFWGVAVGEDYQKGKPAYGYSYFKRSFGGYVDSLIKPQEFSYQNIKYFLIRLQQKYREYKLRSKGYL